MPSDIWTPSAPLILHGPSADGRAVATGPAAVAEPAGRWPVPAEVLTASVEGGDGGECDERRGAAGAGVSGGVVGCMQAPFAPRQPAGPGCTLSITLCRGGARARAGGDRTWASRGAGSGMCDPGHMKSPRSGNNRGSFPRLACVRAKRGVDPRIVTADRPHGTEHDQREEYAVETADRAEHAQGAPAAGRRPAQPGADRHRRPRDVRRVRPRGAARRDRPPGRRRQRHALPATSPTATPWSVRSSCSVMDRTAGRPRPRSPRTGDAFEALCALRARRRRRADRRAVPDALRAPSTSTTPTWRPRASAWRSRSRR